MLNIPQEKLTAIKNFAHQYIFKLLCQQDIPFILAHLDPQLIGIGAAEHNYYDTPQAAKDFILSLEGQIPACELLNEEWTILPLAQGLYLAQGRHYLTSDEDQQCSFRHISGQRSSYAIWAVISAMSTSIFPIPIRNCRVQKTFLFR